MAGPELNLLDYEIENQPEHDWNGFIGAAAIALTVIIMLVLWGNTCSTEKKLDAEAMRLQSQLERLKPVSNHEFTVLNKRVESKQIQLERIMAGKPQWSTALADAESCIPEEVTIESIDAAERSIKIRGSAPGFSTLMKMAESLSADPGLAGTRITSAEEIDGQVFFEIVISV